MNEEIKTYLIKCVIWIVANWILSFGLRRKTKTLNTSKPSSNVLLYPVGMFVILVGGPFIAAVIAPANADGMITEFSGVIALWGCAIANTIVGFIWMKAFPNKEEVNNPLGCGTFILLLIWNTFAIIFAYLYFGYEINFDAI